MSDSVSVRHQRILEYLVSTEIASVGELSSACHVSEMTIRRDLAALSKAGKIRRVRGGALLANGARRYARAERDKAELDHPELLILNPMDPRMARMIVQNSSQRGVPIVAESIPFEGSATLVAIDSFQAGLALGRWAATYALDQFSGEARVLFVGFPSYADTAERERGFFKGFGEVLPEPDFTLSVNGQGVRDQAREMCTAALSSYPHVNIIVGANDQSTLGALDVLRLLRLPVENVLLGTFGLEGAEGRRVLMLECPRSVGIAMFPELIGRVCADVSIRAFNKQPLPEHVVTPVAVVTGETLGDYYRSTDTGWEIRWDIVMSLPDQEWSSDVAVLPSCKGLALPRGIDFVRYLHDEYYDQLVAGLRERAADHGVDVRVTDASADLAASIDAARRAIGRAAAALVGPGEAVVLDAGSTNTYLAQELALRTDEEFTVITHSVSVIDALRDAEHVTLISIGGILHRPSGSFLMAQPTDSLNRLRVDKAFMGVTGLRVEQGLFNVDLAQMDFKRWMMDATEEIIVVADSYKIGQVALARIGPITAMQRLVTDDQISARDRLALMQAGIDVIVAGRVSGDSRYHT